MRRNIIDGILLIIYIIILFVLFTFLIEVSFAEEVIKETKSETGFKTFYRSGLDGFKSSYEIIKHGFIFVSTVFDFLNKFNFILLILLFFSHFAVHEKRINEIMKQINEQNNDGE